MKNSLLRKKDELQRTDSRKSSKKKIEKTGSKELDLKDQVVNYRNVDASMKMSSYNTPDQKKE